MGGVMREPQTGKRMGGQAGVNRADRPSLLAENKTTAGRKICVGHFCNSKRLGPALALTVNESKPGMALPVSRLSPGSAHRGPTPPPGQASWNPPSSPEGRLALRGRVCHRQRPDTGSLRVKLLPSSSACCPGPCWRGASPTSPASPTPVG